jgi:hypothetical protein
MRFTLFYKGPLRANAGPEAKHELRKYFHKQLSVLWKRLPLSELYNPSIGPGRTTPGARCIELYTFLPIATPDFAATIDLNVQLLRPGSPGAIVSPSGDIDNRLKTLFDALSIPQSNQLPKHKGPAADENPMFCVLADDKLISSISVRTLELLDPTFNPREVMAVIDISTQVTHALSGNTHLR